MLNKNIIQISKLLVILILLSLSIQTYAQEIQFNTENDSTKITDGPYIFWNETEAVIKHLFDGNLIVQNKIIRDEENLIFNLEGIDGEFEICSGGIYSYTIESLPETINLWTATGGKILNDRTSDSIAVRWDRILTRRLMLVRTTLSSYGDCSEPFIKFIE